MNYINDIENYIMNMNTQKIIQLSYNLSQNNDLIILKNCLNDYNQCDILLNIYKKDIEEIEQLEILPIDIDANLNKIWEQTKKNYYILYELVFYIKCNYTNLKIFNSIKL